MCLGHGQVKKRTFIKKLKFEEDKYIKLWKLFDIDKEGNLVAQFHDYTFQKGKNTATGKTITTYKGYISNYQYKPGFHCFIDKKDAEKWLKQIRPTGRSRTIVPVKVRKSWITNVGYQEFQFDYRLALVCKHIFI